MDRLPKELVRKIFEMDMTYHLQFKLVLQELTTNARYALFECYQHSKPYDVIIDGPSNRYVEDPHYGCQHYFCWECIITKLVRTWLDCFLENRRPYIACPHCQSDITEFVETYIRTT
jgi:hypothetical protein